MAITSVAINDPTRSVVVTDRTRNVTVTPAVSNNSITSVEVTDRTRSVTVSTVALPSTASVAASAVTVTPYNTITATNLNDALQQLADQDFRGTSTPTGDNIQEGDTWYDTDDDQMYVYRETSPGTFEWVPIILGTAGGDSDTLDAGAF